MNAYYKGKPVFGPRGPAGPDGNPIGTIISYMGLTAPKDYLICDGAAYNISDYPDLATFFAEQFGSANHFGGDGETMFAVPDMRNLFLRGYHGEAEEQLSGAIGEKQEATEHLNIAGYNDELRWNNTLGSTTQMPVWEPGYRDSMVGIVGTANSALRSNTAVKIAPAYTARPVNMAVLYCIKAVESAPAENVYSTEETRIGTWIDGKPLYRKTVNVISPANNGAAKVGDLSADVSMARIYGYLYQDGESCLPIPFFDGTNLAWLYAEAHSFYIGVSSTYFRSKPVAVILEYTKTTG